MLRHDEVERDRIRSQFGVALDGLLAIAGLAHNRPPGLGGQVLDHFPNDEGVVGN